MKRDPLAAPLAPVDRALLRFAHKLTLDPAACTREDLDALRAHGLEDRALHDAVQVIALFNYYNRIADGLGVTAADDDPPAIGG